MTPRLLGIALGASLFLNVGPAGLAAEPAATATSSTAAPGTATAAGTAPAPAHSIASTGIAVLAGAWIVDLRPSPDDPPYDKRMVLEIAADRTVRGSFYDSDIEAGRASASNGRTCFAFRTTDGVGPYHTSGCLIGDRIVGQTWAEHRKFVLNWSARRE
jgi:hypothetical protein